MAVLLLAVERALLIRFRKVLALKRRVPFWNDRRVRALEAGSRTWLESCQSSRLIALVLLKGL